MSSNVPVNLSDSFFKQLLDNLYDAVYFVDRGRRITYWNRAAERLSGFAAREVVGTRCAQNLMHVDHSGRKLCGRHCPLRATMGDLAARQADVYLCHKDGHRVPVSVRAQPIMEAQGRVIGAVEIFSDNTRLQQSQRRLGRLKVAALTDPLTRIGNRRHLENALAHALADHRHYSTGLGVLLIDVDHFKAINDTYGHDCGDQVLAGVARTLAATVRSGDALGRWGGDEFMVILPGIRRKALAGLAERCRILVQRSVVRGSRREINVTVSIGGTLAKKTDTAETLLRRVDEQLYVSKVRGRNQASVGDSAPQRPRVRKIAGRSPRSSRRIVSD